MRSAPRPSRRARHERGAAAVEMAIILPLLLLLIGGIVDMGRMFYTKEILTNAAREGARVVAVGYTQTQASARITQALAGSISGSSNAYSYSNGSGCPTTPGPTDAVSVTVTAPFQYLVLGPASRFFGVTALSAPVLTGTSSMRCGG